MLNRYGGGREEANEALLTVFRVTNKGLAHITEYLTAHPESGRQIEIASRLVPLLVVTDLYMPLGLESPNYEITSRPREA